MVDFPSRKDHVLDLLCTNQPSVITQMKSRSISYYNILLDAICKHKRSKQPQHNTKFI